MKRMLLLGLALLACSMAALAQTATPPAKPATKTDEKPAPPVEATVKGVVKEYPAIPLPADMIVVTLESDGGPIRLTLCPKGYLDKVGATLANGTAITVTGKQRTDRDHKVIMEAATLTVGDKTYTLREKGKPGWSMMDYAVMVTLDGTVTKLVTPEAAKPADPATTAPATTTEKPKPPAPPKPVGFVLMTDKGNFPLNNVAPAEFLAKIGLTLKNDQKVSVQAWQLTFSGTPKKVKGAVAPEATTRVELNVKSITVDGTVYSLRNDAGKGLWEIREKPANDGKREGGKRDGEKRNK
jgi:hypothetical protein